MWCCLFSVLPTLLPLSLASKSAFLLLRDLSLSLNGSPTYLSCLAIGCSAFYYTKYSNTSSQIYKYPTTVSHCLFFDQTTLYPNTHCKKNLF